MSGELHGLGRLRKWGRGGGDSGGGGEGRTLRWI